VETRLKSESLEPLIGFLAFLVQKFQPKKLNLNKNTQNVFLAKFWLFYPLAEQLFSTKDLYYSLVSIKHDSKDSLLVLAPRAQWP